MEWKEVLKTNGNRSLAPARVGLQFFGADVRLMGEKYCNRRAQPGPYGCNIFLEFTLRLTSNSDVSWRSSSSKVIFSYTCVHPRLLDIWNDQFAVSSFCAWVWLTVSFPEDGRMREAIGRAIQVNHCFRIHCDGSRGLADDRRTVSDWEGNLLMLLSHFEREERLIKQELKKLGQTEKNSQNWR